MRVTKRSGRIEDTKFDKVVNRISQLTYNLSDNIDSTLMHNKFSRLCTTV